jgi:hypothetical protein
LAKKEATVDLAGRTAEAAAKAQADAAKKAEILGNTEGVKGFAAQVTDLFCMAGQFFGTAQNPDTRSAGQSMKQACGVSDQIRDSMARDVTGQGAATTSPPPAPQPQREAATQPPPVPPPALPKAAPYKIIKVVPATGPQQEAGREKFRPYDPSPLAGPIP